MGMWLAPIGAAAVALVFSAALLERYIRRRRHAQLLWATALLMYAGGSFALALGVRDGWSGAEYRWYWALGAVLNVPYLAAGELFLLARDRRVRLGALVLLLFGTAFALARVRTGTLDAAALGRDLPLGREAWGDDPFVLAMARFYALPAYAFLVGGTLWSAWRMRGRPELRARFSGTLGIAVGATIVAAGSVFARTGQLVGFSATLVAGIAVMFWGFLEASRTVSGAPSAP
jgi:hypothetical protein